jgi:hypothetical protein
MANILAHLAELTSQVPGVASRARLKPDVLALLEALKLPADHADWLIGPGPRFHVPNGDAFRLRAERMAQSQALVSPQRAITRTKFLWISWPEYHEDGGLSTLSLAAEECGVKEASFRVRHSLAKQRLRLECISPWTGQREPVEIEPLEQQPTLKHAAMAEAIARIERVRALRAKPKSTKRRGAY